MLMWYGYSIRLSNLKKTYLVVILQEVLFVPLTSLLSSQSLVYWLVPIIAMVPIISGLFWYESVEIYKHDKPNLDEVKQK